MAGFDNDVMYATNVDFSGGNPVSGKVTADGQLLIGSTAAPNLRVNTLTAGTGITVTNGAGSITVGTSSKILTWSVTTFNSKASWNSGEGWFSTNTSFTIPLPASGVIGDIIGIGGYNFSNAGQRWIITQAASQFINFGSSTTTTGVGGSLTAASPHAVAVLVCVGVNQWTVVQSIGNLTVV